MKSLKFIGMAMVAILACANFAACNKDDSNKSVGEKKLVKIAYDDGLAFTFSYDNPGRAIEAREGEEDWHDWVHSFTWEGNTLKVTDNGRTRSIYTVDNGLVQKEYTPDGDSYHYYSYNSAGRLVRISGHYNSEFTWSGDKLISTVGVGDFDTTYTYGNVTCNKGYYPLFSEEMINMAHPEIFGMKTTQLPVGSTNIFRGSNSENNFSETYAYEFDAEGYISKIITTKKDGTIYSCTLTWQ